MNAYRNTPCEVAGKKVAKNRVVMRSLSVTTRTHLQTPLHAWSWLVVLMLATGRTLSDQSGKLMVGKFLSRSNRVVYSKTSIVQTQVCVSSGTITLLNGYKPVTLTS